MRYYDDALLWTHLQRDHFYCHVCARTDVPGTRQYFSQYADLERHFRRDHFVCSDAACRALAKFECFETALEGSALTVGVENPATMAIVIELARVLRAGGELSAAESFLEHVVRFRAKALGYSHGDTLAAVHQLGLCAAAQGDFVAAKSHYSDALEALERQVRAPGTQPRPYPPYPWLPRPFPALTPLRSPMWRPTLRRW